jgi:two-component system cell cycle sensor histidine kinase/response regulator CckA
MFPKAKNRLQASVETMRSKLRILHLEDDPRDSEIVESLLIEEGIDCDMIRVSNREQFRSAIEQEQFDIILADYSLPSFDGMSALAIALSQRPTVPFILLSGTAGEEVAAESVKSGATDYVLKDRPSRLVPSIRRALREAEERRELQRAEQSLRESEERLRTVIQHMPVLMVAFDQQGSIVAWNQECENVTGYKAGEMVGDLGAMERLHPDAAQRMVMMAEWRWPPRDYRGREWELTCKDNTVRTVSWSNISKAFPVADWSSWVIGIDITAAKRAQAEREQMQSKLLQTQKLESLGVLAGGIAHDFNNLLTGILGNAGLALLRLEASSPARECIQRVIGASERAAELTRQMLAYAGKASFEIRPISLSEHILETTHHLTATISKKVSFDLRLGDGLPAVEVDPAQIQQLAMNLIINAAESCGDGPGTVMVSTRQTNVEKGQHEQWFTGETLSPGCYVCLEVQDSGCGMDEETVAKIFDPFFSTKFTGRGLGLSTVLGIVRAHRGSLQVKSSPGQGSTFKVLLPASQRSVGDQLADQRLGSLSGRGLILVVDDELFVLEVARRILEGYGYDVVTAENGRQGLEIFRQKSKDIDLVLLDKTMPDLDGEETYRAMKALEPGLVAILTSGYQETEVTSHFLSHELAGFVQKPYLPETLAFKVKQALERSPRPTQLGQAKN